MMTDYVVSNIDAFVVSSRHIVSLVYCALPVVTNRQLITRQIYLY